MIWIFPLYIKASSIYYQEWNDTLFLHYKVPLEVVRKLVPKGLDIDMYEGDVWVSLVAFTMDKVP